MAPWSREFEYSMADKAWCGGRSKKWDDPVFIITHRMQEAESRTEREESSMDLKKKISCVKKILKRNYIIFIASCFIFAMKL